MVVFCLNTMLMTNPENVFSLHDLLNRNLSQIGRKSEMVKRGFLHVIVAVLKK